MNQIIIAGVLVSSSKGNMRMKLPRDIANRRSLES